MVKYTHLNRDPGKAMEDLVKKLSASSKGQKTKPTGVKDLGDAGDVVWTREDGSEQSARLIDVDLEEARATVSELRDVTMPALEGELSDARTDLQQKLDAANARIDDIIVDGGGAGNFTTYSINEPSSDGTGEGDQWFRVVNGEVIGQWRWDGAAWVAVTLTDAIIAGIDLSKLTSSGGLSEVVADRMFTDIFTANKITAQEVDAASVSALLGQFLEIHADQVVGGAFTGETFTGGTFTGGLFKTSDALPGQVVLSDDALNTSLNATTTGPGIRVVPENASGFEYMPGIGPSTAGLMIYGGKKTGTGSSIVQANPDGSFLRTFRSDGARAGEVQTSPTASYMRTYRTDGGTAGEVQASSNQAFLQTYSADGRRGVMSTDAVDATMRTIGSNGLNQARISASGNTVTLFSASNGQRYLELNETGIWIRTGPSGNQKVYNLEETAQDSGWINLSAASGITMVDQIMYRNKGGVIFFAGVVARAGNADWSTGWTTISTIPEGTRPAAQMLRAGVSSTADFMLRVTPTGALQVSRNARPSGYPERPNAQVHISPMFHVAD